MHWDGIERRKCPGIGPLCGLDGRALELFLDSVAERGAHKALAVVGLNDNDAGNDVREIRAFISGWRSAKKNAFNQFSRIIVLVFFLLVVSLFMGSTPKDAVSWLIR